MEYQYPLTEEENEKLENFIFQTYKPDSLGNINKLPPRGIHFVTLYFNPIEDFTNIRVENRYNVPLDISEERQLYDFKISNVCKNMSDFMVTVKIIRQ